jgi:hypothetical protein
MQRGYDERYFEGLTSEVKVIKMVKSMMGMEKYKRVGRGVTVVLFY